MTGRKNLAGDLAELKRKLAGLGGLANTVSDTTVDDNVIHVDFKSKRRS